MNQRVSIVQHFTGDLAHLGAHLGEIKSELAARGAGDELILVDDTGTEDLVAWLAEHHAPDRSPADKSPAGNQSWVRRLPKNRREGRSKAQLMGAQAATGEYLLLLGPQMQLCRGALGPLIAAMNGPNVFAVAPRIVNALTGEPEVPGALAIKEGRPVVLPSPIASDEAHLRSIPFASGSALFTRREAFLARAGFEDLFPSPYWDDVDLGLTVWREGLRILEVPQSVVERHPIENPEVLTPAAADQAALERGRLHLMWKHLDNREEANAHVQSLLRDSVDAALNDRREELIWLAMALEDLEEVGAARKRTKNSQVSLPQVLVKSDPAKL